MSQYFSHNGVPFACDWCIDNFAFLKWLFEEVFYNAFWFTDAFESQKFGLK